MSVQGHAYQPPLALDGTRLADPGEPAYTAPYWVPAEERQAHRLPTVLFTDPWPAVQDPQLRQAHARLCLEYLKRSGKALAAQDIFDGVNAASGSAMFGSVAYVHMLMENLRRSRIVFGKKNPSSDVPHGSASHPRLYTPLPYQQARLGPPEQLAREDAEAQQKKVARALKRLKDGKPPYAIHRPRAVFSVVQHALVEEHMQRARASRRAW